MCKASNNLTDMTLNHYLQAFSEGDIDAILSDYTDDSVLLTPAGAVRGLDQLRMFFKGFMNNLPAGFLDSFNMVRKDVEGDIGYVVWQSGHFAPLGTDTFVVRDGKIMTQTFTAYSPH
jgi:ketosteroid isomerase-like protein